LPSSAPRSPDGVSSYTLASGTANPFASTTLSPDLSPAAFAAPAPALVTALVTASPLACAAAGCAHAIVTIIAIAIAAQAPSANTPHPPDRYPVFVAGVAPRRMSARQTASHTIEDNELPRREIPSAILKILIFLR
jgi:hypothetical protein